MRRLSERDKTLLRLTAVAVCLYLLLDLILLPYWDVLGETRSKTKIQAKRFRNYHKILQREGSMVEEGESLHRQIKSLEQGLLDSPGDALAGAEIQGLVKDIAMVHGLTIQSSDLLPVKRISSDYSKVSTRVSLTGAINQFVDLMVSMGSGPKILFVEDLRIVPTHINAPKQKDIKVRLAISALKQVELEKPSSSQLLGKLAAQP